jgi:Sulfotransferase family
MTTNTLVEILDVSLSATDPELLWGCAIDNPRNGSKTNTYTIDVSGWVLGKNSPAIAVELVSDGRVLKRISTNNFRPDVGKVYSEVPGSEHCGFFTTVGVIGTSAQAELLIYAVLEDNSRVSMGVVKFQHQPLRSHYQPKLQPLMLTSGGRTGTTLLMRILSEHPQIIIYKEYPYEIRVAQYWMWVLKVLSEPADHLESSPAAEFDSTLKWAGHNPFFSKKLINNPELISWLGSTYPEQITSFFQQKIDDFYLASHRQTNQSLSDISTNTDTYQPVYFSEKFVPKYIQSLFWELYPQGREIFLVRDFRDMLCSILAFNSRRKSNDFGRQDALSDEDYVRRILTPSIMMLRDTWKSRSVQSHLVRYEDLILSPVTTLSSILEYLGLENTPAIVEKMIETASEDTPALQEHRTTSDPKSSIGRWRQELEPSMQAICQESFGEALEEFGYKSS